MNIQYQNDLESSIYYLNKQNDDLKQKLIQKEQEIQNLKSQLEHIKAQLKKQNCQIKTFML